ncbi:MAG TPA: hypothetical protein VGL99_23615 [Chloroflexota bacterium]
MRYGLLTLLVPARRCALDPAAPTRVTLAARQLATLSTGPTSSYADVPIGSSNGWDTNFDNFELR